MVCETGVFLLYLLYILEFRLDNLEFSFCWWHGRGHPAGSVLQGRAISPCRPLERGARVHVGLEEQSVLLTSRRHRAPRGCSAPGAAAERPAPSAISALPVLGIISPRVRSYLRVRLLEMTVHRVEIETRVHLSGGDAALRDPSSLPAEVVRAAGLAPSSSALLVSCPETSLRI